MLGSGTSASSRDPSASPPGEADGGASRAWRFGFARAREPRPAFDGDLRPHLEEVHDLLCVANRKGVRVPSDIITVMVEVRHAYDDGRKPDAGLETRFWNAYGLLRSAIEPTHRARRTYRYVFYATLLVLLLCQLGYLFGASVRDQITRLDNELVTLTEQRQVATAAAAEEARDGVAPVRGVEAIDQQIADNRVNREEFGKLAWQLVPWLENEVIALAALKIYLDFFSAYVLPALYGLLGSCAFVLRQLSDDIGKLRFASDVRGQYTLRLNIGLLAGLAVGWFISPGEEASVVANLPPLALAFVAGYGSDLLFAVLDRIVHAFSSPQGDGTVVREESAGGLERVEERRVQTRVSDGVPDARAGEDREGADERPGARPDERKPRAA